MRCLGFTFFLAILELSQQLPITSPELTFSQLNPIKLDVFSHRSRVLKASNELRSNVSLHIEGYFNRTLETIEENILKIHTSEATILGLLTKENETPCIKNLRESGEMVLENAGYAISNCIYDGDGVANSAYRSFYQIIDARERDFNLEPVVLTNAFSGRNIFTQSRLIITRALNQLNARVTSFDGMLVEIAAKLTEVTGIVEEQIQILNKCFTSVEATVTANIKRVSNSLAICQGLVRS